MSCNNNPNFNYFRSLYYPNPNVRYYSPYRYYNTPIFPQLLTQSPIIQNYVQPPVQRQLLPYNLVQSVPIVQSPMCDIINTPVFPQLSLPTPYDPVLGTYGTSDVTLRGQVKSNSCQFGFHPSLVNGQTGCCDMYGNCGNGDVPL